VPGADTAIKCCDIRSAISRPTGFSDNGLAEAAQELAQLKVVEKNRMKKQTAALMNGNNKG